MHRTELIEFIKWVEKLQNYHYMYYESRNIDDFKKWMDASDMVKCMSELILESLEKQRNEELYSINLN